MVVDEKARALGAATLPVAAVAVYLLGIAYSATPAYASSMCYYAGQEYSQGACVQSCSDNGQICDNGTWSACGMC